MLYTHHAVTLEPPPFMKPPLVEGVDYYLEDGKIVLTSVYHFKRGFCCNSRCRHCPYKGAPRPEPEREKLMVVGVPLTIKMPK